MSTKTTKTLREKLERYNAVGRNAEILDSAGKHSMRADKERRILEIRVCFDCLIPKCELHALEECIREAYGLNAAKLLPSYPAELFDGSYIPELILELESIGLVARGFFDRYDAELKGDLLRIGVDFDSGGMELLRGGQTAEILSNIIRSEFGLSVRVEIYDSGRSEERYNVFLARRNEQIADISREMAEEDARNRERSQKADEDRKAEEEKLALPRVESLYEKTAGVESLDDDCYSAGFLRFNVSEPELIYGNLPAIVPTAIRSLNEPKRNVVCLGVTFGMESKLNRRGDKLIITFGVTDEEASITAKMVGDPEKLQVVADIKDGTPVAIRGNVKFDTFDNELTLTPTDIVKVKKLERMDNSEEKRVELHLHTTLSAMDATINPAELVRTVKRWGHKAVAVTDHGNVQVFPEILEAAEAEGVKVIYGMEAYFVDDTARAVYGMSDETAAVTGFDSPVVVFDIETTGLSPQTCKITEIGAVLLEGGEIKDTFNTFVDPEIPIPANITEITGITDDMVAGAPKTEEAVRAFLEFAGDRLLIAHNANFDTGFIRAAADEYKIPFENPYLDTLALSRHLNPELKNHKLDTIADYYELGDFNHHRASDDAYMLAMIYLRMTEQMAREGVADFAGMLRGMQEKADPLVLKSYHMIILVKDLVGLKNLYKLVSRSYLEFHKYVPRIPRTALDELREGLIIGSACESGELFSAMLEGKPHASLVDIAKYYDYLEIQPICNNRFLVREGRAADDEALRDYNRRIVALGEELSKPVVATCDAHFMNSEDEIARKILLAGMKFRDYDSDVGLYLRTTEEMLEEFSYLGEEKAREVVIANTNLIADMIGDVRPIPKGTFTPNMEGADQELTEMCWNKARSWYGDPVPEIVSARLERELSSIIKNGFAVLYIIAQRLVSYSEEQGYLVGSRGSVGSSFVAAMAGISEVNPLPPHYRCPNCRYSDFEAGKAVGSGFDLPDKDCPVCGQPLMGDGHDIPFETFLGFYGEKSPDIDLNFSGEVQGRVHKYTEQLFGKENVFRAGTLGTLASKTAYGFVAKYIEGKGISVNKAEMNRLINKCVGVKRTTGQHPGGIIVIPREYEIYDFTPVQHPADDSGSDVITTHFAFSYLHDTILKLDELGHDVPTKYKVLEDYTGKSVMDTPMNDQAVYELFRSTKSLGVTPEDIGTPLGTIGLPEFGTNFVIPVVVESKPKNFADLLQISGLTHGTDVWLGNAQDLIRDGICDISQVVGTRDGIMLDLIKYGLDNAMSFKIMEFVRKNKKGKAIPDEMVKAMREHDVPEWYIDSLQKIKYMFPKAHAAAYVMSAIRLGWFKVYMPLEFYAAFLTAAPGGFDGETVSRGRGAVQAAMDEIKRKGMDATQRESDMYSTFQMVNESMARGIRYLPVDLYKSSAKSFLPEDGAIRIPFNSLPGLGDTAAEKIVAVASQGELFSVEELQQRGQLSKSVIEILEKNGVLSNMSRTNQISLF
ncbi:MAG: PolC-type DNA polymerase III [Clostridiales bacterium]|nr:PolC-type DNA polymerase III [Clostridiales bacterium]